MQIKAIIAAGGKGTRLRPLTFTSSKHLLPIANKPMLLYPIEAVAAAKIKEVGVIVNETRPAIENLLEDGKKWGLKITYIDQPLPLGVGHVVKISQNFIGHSSFVYLLGDNIFTDGISSPIKHFQKTRPDALLTIIEHKENFRLGVPYFDKHNKLVKIVEKPKNPPNNFAVPGLYLFSPSVFAAFKGKDRVKPSTRGELEIVDLYNYLLLHNYRVEYCQVSGNWLDPGKFDDSLIANRLLLDLNCKSKIQGKLDNDSKIVGRVVIGKGTDIIRSQIYGPTSIGNDVHLEDCYIGPYTSIADGCEIRNAAIEDSILMERVDIADIPGRIEASMIGKDAMVVGTHSAKPAYKLTVSDMSLVELPRT